MSELNPPLVINIRVFDVETDTEEDKKVYKLSKVQVDGTVTSDRSLAKITEEYERQKSGLEKKWKSLQDLIIWAMNNGKEVVFTNSKDEE